ncbi:translation initiation factor 2 [Pseudophaeobacter leonis]|uniref:translation initiation factor 2 n=1 Tax=Pseudophaeobacter leonis TaxID=1144477 RepID=UPI00188306C3|nr:translation initiation factor 2 [Pseudophaeobacter leonis]
MKIFVLAATAALSLSACATVTKGTSEDVQFTSNPAGLKVETSNGMQCTTPCILRIERKQKFMATFRHGAATRTISVSTQVRETGGAALAGNILAGGVIGIGIDAAPGSSLDHIPNPVHADFSKPQAEQINAAEFLRLEKEKNAARKN